MKKRANMVLVISAFLYSVMFVVSFMNTAPWVEALYWMTQSALIGSIADWFAVEALFRKPLGIPYHTALIPRQKEKLAEGIVRLVQERFLRREELASLLEKLEVMPWVRRYLDSDAGRHMVTQGIHSAVQTFFYSRTKEEWARYVADNVRNALRTQDIATPLQTYIASFCRGEIGADYVTSAISYLQGQVRQDRVQRWILSIVEQAVSAKKREKNGCFIWIASFFDVVNERDMVEAISLELERQLEAWKDPNYSFRRTCLAQWGQEVERLIGHSEMGLYMDQVVHQWVEEIPLERLFLDHLWPLLEGTIEGRHVQPEKHLFTVAGETMFWGAWEKISKQVAFERRVEEVFQHVIRDSIPTIHGLIGSIIRYVLHNYSEVDFIRFVESKVEDDLAWIRINGAYVGATLGFLIWTFLMYVYTPVVDALIRVYR